MHDLIRLPHEVLYKLPRLPPLVALSTHTQAATETT